MALEIFRPFENDEYGKGLILQEYEGSYYLISASRSNQGGTVYKKWGFPSGKDKKPISRVLPWQVKIGENREEAARILKYFLSQIVGNSESPESDSIPF